MYNALEWLDACVSSVLNQTFQDFELILVDDGSTDNSLEIAKEYEKNDSRIKLLIQKNSGVSEARNVGIKTATGKYITFVDADDTLENNFLQEAYEIIEKNNLDIIIGGYNEIKNGNIVRTRLSLPGLHIYEGKTIDNFFENSPISSFTNSFPVVIIGELMRLS